MLIVPPPLDHLGHFLLFQLLKPMLLASSTTDINSRVIVLSSIAHRHRQLDLEKLNLKGSNYTPIGAYADSKLSNLYFANELDRRYGHQGLHALSVHPGGVATPIQRHMDPSIIAKVTANPEMMKTVKSLEQGAATTVWASVARSLEGKGGMYLEDCQIAELKEVGSEGVGVNGYAPWAYDEAKEGQLWEKSLSMVGMKDD